MLASSISTSRSRGGGRGIRIGLELDGADEFGVWLPSVLFGEMGGPVVADADADVEADAEAGDAARFSALASTSMLCILLLAADAAGL